MKAGGVLMLRIPKGVRQLDCCTGPYGLKVRWTSFERPPHAVAFDVSALSAE